jgi:RimJ/RimL family protein N-acetyltransferase
MAEAIQLILQLVFKKLKLNRIEIGCSTKNKASRKVIEKAGAKYEGTQREAMISGLGKKHDMRVYSILAKEWKNK